MSMSGVEIDAAVSPFFNDMKLNKIQKWATFKIENKKKVVIDAKGDPKLTEDKDVDKVCFEEFKKEVLKEDNDPRYALYDFGFMTKEGRKVNKIAFIFVCFDTAKIGSKMIYASTKDTVKKAFTGLSLEFQANDRDDLDYDAFAAEVERKA